MKKRKIYCIIIYLMIIFPYMSYIFIGKYSDRTNHENHELTTIEDVIEADYLSKTSTISTLIDDNFPYKNEIAKINTYIEILLFKDLDSDSVLLGKDNWLFYKKDNCIEDYTRNIQLTDEQITRTLTSFGELQDYCNNEDIELYLLVTPNKENIYGEAYFPNYIKKTDNISRSEKLIDILKNEIDLKVVYPTKELIKYSNNGIQVYKKYDTHWNMLGGYVGTKELLNEMNIEILDLNDAMIVENGYISGDLANMISMSNHFDDDINYVIDDYSLLKDYEILEEVEEQNLNYVHSKSLCYKEKDTVLCIGDSFLEMMEPYLSSIFKETYFMHRANYKEGYIENIKPNKIIISATERSFPYIYYDIESILDKLE